MGQQHAETLRRARVALVESRRRVAEELTKPFDRNMTPQMQSMMVEVQQAIDAIDKAIVDEESGKATHD
jgi:hypothetical protein